MRKSHSVEFEGATGERLAGRLDVPDGEPRAFALFAHCFTCSKDIFAATRISTALAERGLGVLRFDFTGLGSSEGEFANTGFSSNVGDLVAAADFLRREYRPPEVLVGHSLGGAAVLAAAGRVPEAVGVVTVGAPCDPEHVRRLLGPAVGEIEERGEAEIDIGGRPFRISRQFLEDLRGQRPTDAIGKLGKALLIFHSPQDTVVGIENARWIFEAARHPKSFISLDGADHLLSREEDANYVAGVLSAWVSRYLPRDEGLPAAQRAPRAVQRGAEEPGSQAGRPTDDAAGVPPGTVRVTETGEGKFTQAIDSGRHRLLADEPADYGGDDRGMSPYELLLAALGACTTMTLRMYADRKGWPMEGVSVELAHEKIHAEDCRDCETREGKVDRIERIVEIRGSLDEEQRGRLLEIAERCPVHRTLTGEIEVVSRLRDVP